MDVDTLSPARSSTLSIHAAAVGSNPSSSGGTAPSSSSSGESTSSPLPTGPDPATSAELPSYPNLSGNGEPPLFPPNLSRNVSGTGSNLPSPARGAEHTPPPIEGQGTGAGARGGGGGAASSSSSRDALSASGLRYLENVTLNGGEVTSAGASPGGGGGIPNPYGSVKRAHDRLADGSRSRSRERGTVTGAGVVVGINGSGMERVGSPLAVHAGASVRMSSGQEARLGKSPRLAYASSDRL